MMDPADGPVFAEVVADVDVNVTGVPVASQTKILRTEKKSPTCLLLLIQLSKVFYFPLGPFCNVLLSSTISESNLLQLRSLFEFEGNLKFYRCNFNVIEHSSCVLTHLRSTLYPQRECLQFRSWN